MESLQELKVRVLKELNEAIHAPATDRERWFIKARIQKGDILVDVHYTDAEISRHDLIGLSDDPQKEQKLRAIDARYDEIDEQLSSLILERFVCAPVYHVK